MILYETLDRKISPDDHRSASVEAWRVMTNGDPVGRIFPWADPEGGGHGVRTPIEKSQKI